MKVDHVYEINKVTSLKTKDVKQKTAYKMDITPKYLMYVSKKYINNLKSPPKRHMFAKKI